MMQSKGLQRFGSEIAELSQLIQSNNFSSKPNLRSQSTVALPIIGIKKRVIELKKRENMKTSMAELDATDTSNS